MESIAAELKISELKQNSLSKSYEELHNQASSLLVFSLQWKDLESHFDSTRKSLQTGIEALSEREKAVASREEDLAVRESRLDSVLAAKIKELERIEELIGERSKEIILAERHVDSLKSLVAENLEELEVKEKEFEAIVKSVTERGCELDRIRSCVEEEEKKLEILKSCVSEGEGKLASLEMKIEHKLEEAELKEKEVSSLRRTLREFKDDIEMKNRKFNAIRRNIKEKKKEVELKEEQLWVCQNSIEESEKVIKLKEEELNAIQASTVSSSELELKEKRLDFLQKEIESKERNFVSLENSVDQFAQVFERRNKEIEGLLKELESKEKLYESKFKEVTLISYKVNDCLKEVESREESVEALRKSVEKRNSNLQMKERRFRKRVIDFELEQKKSETSRKASEVRAIENTGVPSSQVKVEQLEDSQTNNAIVPSSASHQDPQTMEGKDLQLLLNRHLNRHDSVCLEVFTILKVSKDPAKLVLDAMDGFYPPRSIGESNGFDVNVVRRSCILVLEQLMQASVQISPQVKEEAMKLASDWRAKMKEREANYLEALGFLQFLTTYRLIPAFDPNDLYKLVGIVGQHGQSMELQQALSTVDIDAPGKLKIVQPSEISLDTIMTNSPNLQFDTMVNILNIFRNSPDPAKHALDYIQGPFSQAWKTGRVGVNVLSNCIILLEQLLRMSPQIQPLVREEAMKVATEWKANVEASAENPLDSLVVLQFLDTYGLVSSFDSDDIVNLLKKIFRENSVLKVIRTVGFANKIPEFVQNLIEKKKLVDAVRLICAFELTNKFTPVKLLTKYMEELKESTAKLCKGKRSIEEKEKATDDEIAALQAVRECVEELKLANFLLAQVNRRISLLENTKAQRRRDLKPHDEKQQEQQPCKKRSPGSGFPHQSMPQQGRQKVPRTDSPSNRLRCPPAFVPIVSQRDPRSNMVETALTPFDRDPRQFSFGGGIDMVGPNLGAGRRY